MRILVVSNLYPPTVMGGYELSCGHISAGLRARGHAVEVLTSPAEVRVDQPWARRTLSMRAFRKPWPEDPAMKAVWDHECAVSQRDNTLQLIDRIEAFEPDLVYCFNLIGIGALALLDAVAEAGVPWVWDLGDRVPAQVTEGVLPEIRDVFRAGERLTAGRYFSVSERLMLEVVDGGVDIRDRTTVMGRGVPDYGLQRTRPYLDGGIVEFVGASSLSRQKGVDIVVDACSLLARRGVENFRVRYYGQGDPTEFRSMAREAGVERLIEFPGFIAHRDLLEVEAGADAFVFPTWPREPGAAVVLEAAAVGCVPIFTGGAGPAERLIDGVDSIKIRRDAESLAAAMESVCRGEVDLTALGAAGVAAGRGPLSFETALDRVEAGLHDALAEAPRRDDDLDAIRARVVARDRRANELLQSMVVGRLERA